MIQAGRQRKPQSVLLTIVLLAIFALSVAGCRPAQPYEPAPDEPAKPPATEPAEDSGDITPVIIDTDMAVDDWIAILFLLRCPDVEVKAITVTGAGESRVGPGVANALGLIVLAGRGDIPVAGGRETPLDGNHAFPTDWRDAMDAMIGMTLPAPASTASEMTAVELIASVVKQSPSNVTIVTLGALTNLAEAVAAEPELAGNVGMVYVMGGAIDAAGNVEPGCYAEWNVYVDPLAAAQVFESGLPVTLVPLDATNSAPLTQAFFDRLAADHGTPEAEFVYGVLGRMQDRIKSGEYYFWDPLCAGIAADESLATIEPVTVRAVTTGAESGRTLRAEEGGAIRVALSADGERFAEILLGTLTGEP